MISNERHDEAVVLTPLSQLVEALNHPQASHLQSVRDSLYDIAAAAREVPLPEVASGTQLLASLIELLMSDPPTVAARDFTALLADIRTSVHCLDELLKDQPGAVPSWQAQLASLTDRWAEYVSLVPDSLLPLVSDSELDCAWPLMPDAVEARENTRLAEWPPDDCQEQVQLLLSAIADSATDLPAAAARPMPVPTTVVETNVVGTSVVGTSVVQTAIQEGPADQPLLDRELAEAYLDDAQRCLTGMEQVVLGLSDGPQLAAQLQQLCRELHTLKGASASVGFQRLARQLHQLEDRFEAFARHPSSLPIPDQRTLLADIDSFRQQIQQLTAQATQPVATAVAASAHHHASARRQATRSIADHQPVSGEETLRVKASQVDRLMDMLAELVMLRNRRDSRVEHLREMHGQLLQLVTRLRSWHAAQPSFATPATLPASDAGESVTDLANSMLDVTRMLRDLFEPMAEEQRNISRFIGQFRQELTELRRLPVAGLFQRLQRAVHDAAQLDGKRVRLQFDGEQTGLERSLQERLYDPLLHIVRNAVSHGIEPTAQRQASGKEPVGTITLEARGGTNLLSVTVRDDGRGLNYDALRRRGIELGLIEHDRPASREELAQLIFRPGFSTSESTSQVSGRGVGMDVVATTLERLHGWIDVESTPGQGTSIRLMLPRRSVIEHAMVFRAAGQLLALPMQFVNEVVPPAGPVPTAARGGAEELVPIHLSRLFSMTPAPANAASQRVIVLQSAAQNSARARGGRSRVAIFIDQIVGPQEIVVRPLPLLLRGHPLFAGVSLSASGDIVLLLDSQRLADWAISCTAAQGIRRSNE